MYSTVIRFELQAPGHETLGGASHYYYTIITMHGLIMVFFRNAGFNWGFGNFIVPLQLGTCEFAFPKISSTTSISFIFKSKVKGRVCSILLNFSFVLLLNYLLCGSNVIDRVGFMFLELVILQISIYLLHKTK